MAEFGEKLSGRELEVLNCLAKGSGNKEIAAELFISENTVKVHLRNIYTKLGASSRTEATAVAIQQGVVVLPGMEPEPEAEPVVETQLTETEPENNANHTVAPAEEEPVHWLKRPSVAIVLGVLSFLLLFVLVVWAQRSFSFVAVTPEPFEPEDIESYWKGLRPLPNPRANMASAAVGLNVYMIGGETETGVDGHVLVYDTTNHTWQELLQKPTAVTDASAAELFGEIYVPGGLLASGQPTQAVEAYSPTRDTWRTIAPLEQPIAGALTLTDGSFLYLFGGWNGSDYLDTAYVYDPGADSWEALPAMSQPRANLSGAAVTGNLYAVGGTDGETNLATCEFFNPVDRTWSDCPEMLTGRANAGAVSIANKLYVVGGDDGRQDTVFSEFYDPKLDAWTPIEGLVLDEQRTWQDMGISHVETGIFLLGGLVAGELSTDSYLYAPPVYRSYLPAAPSGGN